MYWEGAGDPRKQLICRKNGVLRSGGIGALTTTVTPTEDATLLLSKGVHPKVVQELLGHATINIALDTYSHVLPELGDAAA
jgi:integrase